MTFASRADDRTVLVIDPVPRHLQAVARIVRSVASSTIPVQKVELDMLDDSLAMIVASWDRLTQLDRQRLLGWARSNRFEQRLLILSLPSVDYQRVLLDLAEQGIAGLLASEPEVSAPLLMTAMQKILRGDIFGIEKYFNWGVEVRRFQIRLSDDKASVVEQASHFAADLDVHPRLVEKYATVVDELVTNALYNAPVDARGRPRFAHMPRSTPIELSAREAVTIAICSDGMTLGVAAIDSFGAMTREQSLTHLIRCLREEQIPVDHRRGGAGLGLYLMLDSLSHLVLNLAPGRMTEVIGLIDVRGSYKDFAHRGKSFNIFVDADIGVDVD